MRNHYLKSIYTALKIKIYKPHFKKSINLRKIDVHGILLISLQP